MFKENNTNFDAIIIANTAEAFKPYLSKVRNTKEGDVRIDQELALSQRAFFWGFDNKLLITPYEIPHSLLRVNQDSIGYSNIYNISPSSLELSLSKAIVNDTNLWSFLEKTIRNNPGIAFSPYAITDDFLCLVERLRKAGLKILVAELPAPNSLWTVTYLDSKSGFRQEMMKLKIVHKELRIPEGFICADIKEVKSFAIWFYESHQSCVIKANVGESGWGLFILNPNHYSSKTILCNKLDKLFGSDSIWTSTPIVIEELIETNVTLDTNSPSTEIFVSETGPEITYTCEQIISEQGEFCGVELGVGTLDKNLEKRLHRIATVIGKRFWELGYRGFFDIDFVISHDKQPYVIETNTRRTGGTHVYDLANRIYGNNWKNRAYFISNDSFCYGANLIEDDKLIQKLKPFFFSIEKQEKGILLTLINKNRPIIGYVVIARNRKEGRELQSTLHGLFLQSKD